MTQDKMITGKKYRGKIALYIFLQFLQTACALLPPYCYLLFLNQVILEEKSELLLYVCLFYVLVFLGDTLVSAAGKMVYNRIFPAMHMEWKEKVLEKYSRLDMDAVQKYTPGELRERLHRDTENAVLYREKMLEICISSVRILATAGILLYLNRILALVSFLFLPLSYYITRYIKGRSNAEYERRRRVQGIYNDFMIHSLQDWKEIRTDCREEAQQRRFAQLWGEMGDAFLKAHMCWFLNRTFLAFKDVFLTKMGLYLLGGFLALGGYVAVPVLLAFMEYYADLANRLLGVIDSIMRRGEQEESVKKVKEILEIPQPERPQTMDSFESLEFREVDFAYKEEEGAVLEKFSLAISRGESVALVGESGCGKSTLIRLMAGCLVPAAGEIRWNGVSMGLMDRASLYARTGFLMQEAGLFNLSVRENLRFGREDASEAQMAQACARANILNFIEELPRGFDTVIGENGIRLSGGQRQRLMIARLLLQDPEVIVFDEATSALDYQNESRILDLLLREAGEKTFLMVTHRGTSAAKCGRVVRLPTVSRLSPGVQ